jgi:hypothetical protein
LRTFSNDASLACFRSLFQLWHPTGVLDSSCSRADHEVAPATVRFTTLSSLAGMFDTGRTRSTCERQSRTEEVNK